MISNTQQTNSPPYVLIIDDSEDDFYATKRAFAKTNLLNPIKHSSSGEEALTFLRNKENERPGIILLDLNMPGLDGRQTLKIIKEDETLKNIPVVILTTSNNERDIQICYQIGANAFVQKPVDFESLMVAIEQLKEYWFEVSSLTKSK